MQRKQHLTFLFSLLMLVSLGCGLVTPVPVTQVTPVPSTQVFLTSEPPINMPEPAIQNSSQALDNVARMIYDALAEGQNLNSYIDGVITAFGVPPLGENDLDLVKERYEQGLPLMFLRQVPQMADAFHNGIYVSLDSFIAAANEQGATQQGSNEPLTREYLTQKFGIYTGKSQYEPGQVLPAFVLALAKERAAHFPPNDPDPLWGDGLLDPLQFTLLLYSVSYSGVGHISSEVPVTASIIPPVKEISFTKGLDRVGHGDPVKKWIVEQIRDGVKGEVQEIVEVPLDPMEASQVSVCASLLLYGHKLEVTTTPNQIYHKDGEKPWVTQVNVTLTFQDDYYSDKKASLLERWIIEDLADCKLPRPGPAAGKSLAFSVTGELIEHGEFDMTASKTNGDGYNFATWRTVPETTPKSQRTFHNQRQAVGNIIVRAGGLVPGWGPVELVVNHLRDTGAVGSAQLSVIYYVSSAYKVTGEYDGFTFSSGVICDLEKPFTFKANGPMWESNFETAPNNSVSGTFSVTGALTIGGVTTVSGGTYTISPANDGTYQLTLESPSGTFTTEQGYTGDMPGGSATLTLTPLDTQECDGQ